MNGFDIVISYRREDSQPTSSAIYRELVRRFGTGRVLFDITEVPVGQDYDQFVRGVIRQAKAVIVVIGPQWLTVEKKGVRRLAAEDDPVRGEIVAALEASVPLIPLLVQGAQAPDPDALPASIRPLAKLNMRPIDERHWDAEMDALTKRLTPLVTGTAPMTPRTGGSRHTIRRRAWVLGSAVLLVVSLLAVGWQFFFTESTPVKSSSIAKPAEEAGASAPTEGRVSVEVPLDKRPLAITMIHESGKPRTYTAIYTFNDDLWYGQGFASLKRGSLHKLVQTYTGVQGARFALPTKVYLAQLEQKDPKLMSDERFKTLLERVAGEDPVMTKLQDQMIEDAFFGPARKECADIGIKSALGYALVADTVYQSGRVRYEKIKLATIKALDGTPATGISEKHWLKQFANERIASMSNSPFASAIKRRSETYIALMEGNNWDLVAPVPVGKYLLVDPT
jgi:hypothetical protein